MTNINKLFTNLFEDSTISLKRISQFTDDHLKKLSANNADKLYENILQETISIYSSFETYPELKKYSKTKELMLQNKLTTQLSRNALFIAYNNVTKHEIVKTFFDLSILHNPQKKQTSKCIAYPYTITEAASIVFSPTKRLRIMNKGKVTLTAQMTLDGKPIGNTFKIIPRKIIDKTFSDFCNNANAIQITNSYSSECLCLLQEIE